MDGLRQREDFNGRIAQCANLANEKELNTKEMISTVSRGNEGITEYFIRKREKPIQEHISMLDEFQL